MMDLWFYRIMGEEYGPVPLNGLKELAESSTISEFDQVRSSGSNQWVAAGEVDQLGLRSKGHGAVAVATRPSNSDLNTLSPKASVDEWYFKLRGQELGPMGIDELIKYAENEQLTADDEVKLGRNGTWRRVVSKSKLLSVLTSVKKTIVPTPMRSKTPAVEHSVVSAPKKAPARVSGPTPSAAPAAAPDARVAYEVAFEQAKAQIAQSLVAQAEANFKTAEENAKGQIAWTLAANVDPNWWGWASGVEFGPVDIKQVLGLAKSGQLKPTDMVRNGQFAQFGPSSNVPGLFNAVAMVAKAAETLELAKSQASAAVALAAPSAVVPDAITKPIPVPALVAAAELDTVRPTSDPVVTTVARREGMGSSPKIPTRSEMPRPSPIADEPRPSPAAAPLETRSSAAGSGYSSMMSTMSSYGSQRPAAYSTKPARRPSMASDSSFFSDMMEKLKEPNVIGSICAVALVLLIVGWQYLPKSRGADIERYQALKQLLEDFREARANPTLMAALQPKAKAIGKEITEAVKKQASSADRPKQILLWVSRDELPRLLQSGSGGMGTDQAEAAFAMRLKEAAYELGLERRPPVDPAQSAQAQNDD